MNKKNIIIKLIMCFFVSFAWMNIGGLESTNILLLCVFGSCFIVLTYRDAIINKDTDKKIMIISVILGVLFSLLYACFADLSGGLENKAFIFIYKVSTVAGLFFMFETLLDVCILKAVRFIDEKKNLTRNAFSWKVLLIYTCIIYICCIPFFALNYPGVLTVDSLNQLGQVMGIIERSNHHPWIHTAIIGLFYNIGYGISGSTYTGIAFYTAFQILMVGLCVGYAIECMYEAGIKKEARIALLICFVMLPYNLMYAVTMWKDILFTMSVLVFTITMIRINMTGSGKDDTTIRDSIIFVISALFMCLIRHNGFYAFIATVVIWLFIKRKTLKRYILLSVTVIFISILCSGPLMKACRVTPGEYVYNMCMPLQQVGKVIASGEEITPRQTEWLEKVNTLDYVRAGFDVQCADPMFAWVLDGDEKYFDSHKAEFIKIWIQIGLKHPLTYIKAFADLTKGYWTPMNPQQTVYFGMSDNDLNLNPKPVIEGPVLIKINELITKLYGMIPIYGLFYSMGGFFWLLLILGAICIASKNAWKLFAFLPSLMLTFTLFIATPLVADLRYGYALLLILPYLCIYTVLYKNDKESEQ